VRNILYPRIRWSLLPAMLGYAACGAVLAGLYGIGHDEITYTISPEYFTHLKFYQFRYANFGLPPHVFVAEIGFLATWWVGFFSGWFLARIAVPALPPKLAARCITGGFLIIFACALAAAVVGWMLGLSIDASSIGSEWMESGQAAYVEKLRNFVRVAYIHNAGYLGGLIGLIAAVIYVRRCK